MSLRLSFMFVVLVALASSAAAAPARIMSWTIEGVQREALVFAPTAGGAGETHPLVFAFHGHGGNMHGAAKFGLQNRWPRAIVVCPQGLDTASRRDPQGRKHGWQRLIGDDRNRDLKFFDAMLASMRREYRVDERRIFSTGFSNGAFFTLLLWTERSEIFSAFAIVAGSLDPSQHLAAAKPVLQIAGKHDPLVTPDKVRPTVAEERRVDGAEAAGRDCGSRCTLFRGTKADVKVIWHDGGHVYPPQAAEWTIEFFKSFGGAAVGG
ncbi:MAG TPA: hypothetical protein VGH81_13525 [Rudaea sp.]|jgi:polyhydroxybutyrate depolymerase